MAEKIDKENPENREPNVVISVTCGSWPVGLFRQWEQDCMMNYGNCRWMKMWNDHLIAKQATSFAEILKEEIEMLKIKIDRIENRKVNKDNNNKEVLTLGGGLK